VQKVFRVLIDGHHYLRSPAENETLVQNSTESLEQPNVLFHFTTVSHGREYVTVDLGTAMGQVKFNGKTVKMFLIPEQKRRQCGLCGMETSEDEVQVSQWCHEVPTQESSGYVYEPVNQTKVLEFSDKVGT